LVIDVYGGQTWYVARPEPEQEFIGTLEAVPTITGPGNRPSLAFLVRTEDSELPTYAAGVGDLLGSLVGPALRIRGKIVDLTGEGGTREVWIATIAPLGCDPKTDSQLPD
jgi:hypothetical protein